MSKMFSIINMKVSKIMNFLYTYIYKYLRTSRKETKKYKKILKIIKQKIRYTRIQSETCILKDIALELCR